MSLHAGLVAELVGHTNTSAHLAGTGSNPDRVYPLVIPQKVPGGAVQFPCVVYEQVDAQRQVAYCGTNGLVRTSIRLDCYSPSYDTAREVARAVYEVLRDYRGMLGGIVDVRAASLATEFDVQDFEPGLYRVSQSWTFWHLEE
jgi:hypothetical protein